MGMYMENGLGSMIVGFILIVVEPSQDVLWCPMKKVVNPSISEEPTSPTLEGLHHTKKGVFTPYRLHSSTLQKLNMAIGHPL